MMNILAIDPGVESGIAIRFDGGKISAIVSYTPEYVWEIVISMKWNAVVYENFTTAGRISRYGLHTVQIIGGIRALCIERKIKCYPRTPQSRMAFQVQAKNILNKGIAIHAVEALAHLLSWENEYVNQISSKTI